jgi:tetratricopeptide (TPR) repeat protein
MAGETELGGARPRESTESRDAPKSEGATETARPARGATQTGRARTGASLTELELAFAQDPQSHAFAPLCEAYLEQGRFMEAMVVAKKGLKAHPQSTDARILMARVYARQNKLPKALQELDELVAQQPESAPAHVARGKLRADAKDEPGAIADLKRAIDLDKAHEEAKALLKERGIIYPEPIPEPPPPPMPVFVQGPMMRGASGVMVPRAASFVGTMPTGVGTGGTGAMPVAGSVPPGGGGTTGDLPTLGVAPAMTLPPGMMVGAMIGPDGRPTSGIFPAGLVVSQLPKPRLEGEEELEALANRAANERPDSGGNARATIVLGATLLGVLGVGAGWMFHNKRVTEGIAERTQTARAAFGEDTYGSYLRAAKEFEAILEQYDDEHASTLAMLAHTDAILWGEHAEAERRGALDKILARAEAVAADSPHTVAAKGLVALYSGDNRQKSAAAAYDAVFPALQKIRQENGGEPATFADLTMGIVDIELGNYGSAAETLRKVADNLPSSVRAKLWAARAAMRAGSLDKAEQLYNDLFRTAKDHPGARAGRALVRLQRGRLEGAADDIFKFDDFAKKYPKEISDKDRALVEYARSEVFRAAGNLNVAEGAYQMAVRLDPQNADFPYGLGRNLLQNGRAKEALEPLKKAVEKEPNRRAFLIALADAETLVGDYGQAEQHLTTALRQDPRDLAAALARARLLTAQKKPEAETFLKEILDWSKGSPEAKLELGRYFQAVGRKADARPILEDAVQTMDTLPTAKKALIVLAYGKLMVEFEEVETAMNSFKQAGEWGAMEGWYRIVELEVRLGRRDKARLTFACDKYKGAGALPFTAEVNQLCN